MEDAFFRAAAAAESFLTEWFVRCLSFDTRRFSGRHEVSAANQAVADLGKWEPAERLWRRRNRAPDVIVSIPIERRLSYKEASAYLGWSDSTKSFSDAQELQNLATDLLVGRQALRVASLSDSQKRVLDATIGIRNVLAHRSSRAVTEMNRRLTAGGLPASLRRTGNRVSATGVGFYLRSEGGGGCPRYETYYETLAELAYGLAPGGVKRSVCPQQQLVP